MKIHCIGIGGIGVSALAQYYLQKGHTVSGSDLAQSEITDFLAARGITVIIGNKAENITEGIDLVIHSPAVKPENPEYAAAKAAGIPLKSYPEALGELTRQYKTIAISGSHGKSTTTAMVALILIRAGIDPTVIVGTKLKEFNGSNFRMGNSQWLVIEACEYDGSFLHYQPQIEVITNIDKEHLDYFKTFANVKKAFNDFIKKLPADGVLVFNKKARNPEAKKIAEILQVPGKHNVLNALSALDVARALGVDDTISFAALAEFTGTWRRFEIKTVIDKLKAKSYTLISDYGHHPTEIAATFQAAREKFPQEEIWCIFQPHQYQRTHYLFKDFVKLFKTAASAKASASQGNIDQIVITDIYDVAGREEKNISATVSGELLAKKVGKKNVQYMPLDAAETFVKENIGRAPRSLGKVGEVVIIMGAGDVYKLFDRF